MYLHVQCTMCVGQGGKDLRKWGRFTRDLWHVGRCISKISEWYTCFIDINRIWKIRQMMLQEVLFRRVCVFFPVWWVLFLLYLNCVFLGKVLIWSDLYHPLLGKFSYISCTVVNPETHFGMVKVWYIVQSIYWELLQVNQIGWLKFFIS